MTEEPKGLALRFSLGYNEVKNTQEVTMVAIETKNLSIKSGKNYLLQKGIYVFNGH